MKKITLRVFAALALTLAHGQVFAQITAVPNTMNFQGRLARPDGTPVSDGTYSVRFSLWTAATGGTEKWNQTLNVTARNGTFTIPLSNFPAGTFNSDLFLEIKIGNAAPLTPRQPLASVAYAKKADSVKDGSITSASIADGTITAADLSGGFNNFAWLLNGNSGVTNGFLGTTDNKPLVLKAHNHRAMQYTNVENTATPDFFYRSINILGGSEINAIAGSVIGGTISGGGRDFFVGGIDSPNTVNMDFGTIGGGFGNTTNGLAATVAGGRGNTAGAFSSTVAGGNTNVAASNEATVGGGHNNTANGADATVSGGAFNTASGLRSTIPGGNSNTAIGVYAFAAGNRANAFHDGSFVWADSQNADFISSNPNQFLIRAAGGVGINTNTPGFPLSFPDTLGDKIALWGQGGNHFGFGIAPGALQIHAALPENVIDFGFGHSGNFNLSARVYCNGDFLAGRDSYAVVNMFAQNFFENSDARYKQNIATLDNALENILQLRGVTFDWRRDEFKEKQFREGKQVGFIAQEVEKVFPSLVTTDTKGFKNVAYQNVVPVLVEAMKQQQAQITDQQKQIDALKSVQAENAALKQQLTELSETVRQIKAAQETVKANATGK